MGKTFVLFDFDGTLANTMPVIFEAFGTVFEEFRGARPSDAEIVRMFGPTETGTLDAEFPGDSRRAAIIERFYRIYEDEHDRLTPSADEMRIVLDTLRNGGTRIGVFTGKARRSLDISLSKLFPGLSFDILVTGDDVQRPKPDPEGVRLALSRLACPAEQCLFVGDSVVDIEAGRAAGVETIQAGWWGCATPIPDGANVRRFDKLDDFRRFLASSIKVIP